MLFCQGVYPLVITRGSGKSPMNGGSNRKITYKLLAFLRFFLHYTLIPKLAIEFLVRVVGKEQTTPGSNFSSFPFLHLDIRKRAEMTGKSCLKQKTGR